MTLPATPGQLRLCAARRLKHRHCGWPGACRGDFAYHAQGNYTAARWSLLERQDERFRATLSPTRMANLAAVTTEYGRSKPGAVTEGKLERGLKGKRPGNSLTATAADAAMARQFKWRGDSRLQARSRSRKRLYRGNIGQRTGSILRKSDTATSRRTRPRALRRAEVLPSVQLPARRHRSDRTVGSGARAPPVFQHVLPERRRRLQPR